ncbi:MAG: LamG domain-containing protein, partial [Patescibacteria group bacterium]
VYATDANNGFKVAFGGANCTGLFIFEPKKSSTNYGGCGSTSFTVNTWYHLVGVFQSASNTVTFYVNNVVQTTSGFAGGLPSTTGFGYIGVSNAASFFPGSLDDVRIYNRALSAAEVLQLYNLGR